jgi:hypothetical protein
VNAVHLAAVALVGEERRMKVAIARSVRFRGSSSMMAFICARQSTMLPGVGTLPPLRPVPDPRVTI